MVRALLRWRHVLLLLGACLLPLAAQAGEAGVSLHDPWLRFIIRARPAAGYFTLENTAAVPKILTGAQSPACAGLMLHRSVQEGGQDRMAMVMQVTIPAGGSLRFAPGGYHLMCMQPDAGVTVGGRIPITLHFADGGAIEAEFPVKGADGP